MNRRQTLLSMIIGFFSSLFCKTKNVTAQKIVPCKKINKSEFTIHLDKPVDYTICRKIANLMYNSMLVKIQKDDQDLSSIQWQRVFDDPIIRRHGKIGWYVWALYSDETTIAISVDANLSGTRNASITTIEKVANDYTTWINIYYQELVADID